MNTQNQNQPSRVVRDQLNKMKGHLGVLQLLFLNIYASYIFLRPLMVNKELVSRLSSGVKSPGFNQLFDTLYWHFILDLVKIWQDNEAPCLLHISEKMKAKPILDAIRKAHKSVNQNINFGDKEITIARQCRRVHRITAQVVKPSGLLNHYATIRDKLIAHNEAHATPIGYMLFQIKELGLKYGQERFLLEAARVVLADLNAVISDACFDWDGSFAIESKQVADFWDIPISPQWTPPYTKSSERIFRRSINP